MKVTQPDAGGAAMTLLDGGTGRELKRSGAPFRQPEWSAFARPILAKLVQALAPNIDLWLAETLSTVAEAALVRDVMGQDPHPLWLSFTLNDAAALPGQPRLRSGESVQDAAAAAIRLGASALLFNCSQPEVMGDAVDAARAVLTAANRSGPDGIAIGVYANASAPQRADAQANSGYTDIRPDLTPSGYWQGVQEWRARGASIVGGCCGIGPEHILEMRQHLQR